MSDMLAMFCIYFLIKPRLSLSLRIALAQNDLGMTLEPAVAGEAALVTKVPRNCRRAFPGSLRIP
jgi:hypothetical protein